MDIIILILNVAIIAIIDRLSTSQDNRFGLYSAGNNQVESNDSDLIRAFFRFFYILRHKDLMKNTSKQYRLFNKYVIVIFEKRGETITCYELKNPNRTLKAYDFRYYNSKSLMNVFDEILYEFNYDTNFTRIVEENLDRNFVEYFIQGSKNSKKQIKPVKNTKTIDINCAGEKEIASLPGINAIKAKKIIKYRDFHNGFKTLDEFYKQLNVKDHFLIQIESIVKLGKYHTKEDYFKNREGRIVDFE